MPILLFDGVCNLCNASVQWVLRRDRHARFQFAALQSEVGQRLLRQHGLDPASLDSVVLVDGDRVYLRSAAALGVAVRLGGFWRLMGVFYLVPALLRDLIYNWIARNRYRWFGRQEQCWLPRQEWKERFL